MPQSGKARQKRLKPCDPFNNKPKVSVKDPEIDLKKDEENTMKLGYKGREMQRLLALGAGKLSRSKSSTNQQSLNVKEKKSSSSGIKNSSNKGNEGKTAGKRKNKFISEDGTRPLDKFKKAPEEDEESVRKAKKQKREEIQEEVQQEESPHEELDGNMNDQFVPQNDDSQLMSQHNNTPLFQRREMDAAEIAKLKPFPGETIEKFERRLRAAMYKRLDELTIQKKAEKYMEIQNRGPTNRKLKNKAYFEKKKQQKLKKKYPGTQFSDDENSGDEDQRTPDKHKGKMKNFNQKSDPVAFGEVADAPPILKSLPKRKKKANDEEAVIPLSQFREKEESSDNDDEVKRKTKALKDGQFKWKTLDEGERKEKLKQKEKVKKEKEMDERVLLEKRNMEALRMKMYKAYKESKARKIERGGNSFNISPIG